MSQDGPTWNDKQIRLFVALLKRIMWDDGKVTFPEVADEIMALWGEDAHTAKVRAVLPRMYEIARGTNPPFVAQMSDQAEIDAWYQEGDVVQTPTTWAGMYLVMLAEHDNPALAQLQAGSYRTT